MESGKPKITFKNIASYISGHSLASFEKLHTLPIHLKEQIEYRHKICADCLLLGECPVCHCELPAKHYSYFACQGAKYPNLMSKKEWIKYKENNYVK